MQRSTFKAGGRNTPRSWTLPQAWEEWTEAVVGVWMIASPWLLSFADHRGAMSTVVVTGLIAVVLALWRLGTDRQFGWWRERVTH